MSGIYSLKLDQTCKAVKDDVEVESTEEVTTTNKNITCVRKLKAEMEGINNQIAELQTKKVLIQAEVDKVNLVVKDYKLAVVEE
jgi:capsular polysaccharide biosynthesis protein